MADRPARKRPFGPCPTLIAPLAALLWASVALVSVGSELRQSPIVKAVQGARGAIVNIRGEKTLAASVSPLAPTDGARRVNGMGTGVIIDPRGYILTNYHVVDGVREIQVTLANSQKYVGRLLARDLETDLAVIKIDPKEKLPVISVGTSADLMPGESVIAVGNAYGYEHTVTRGIISALHRAVQVSDAQFYDDLIQTDASINPGNSGGPLLNIDGEMIGVNVAVRAGAQGIGFAIPVDKVMAVSADLIASCNGKSTWHGVVLGKPRSGQQGLVVAAVEPDSPAAEAGLEPGAVIRSVGRAEVHCCLDFQRALLERKPGEHLELGLSRQDESLAATLTLAEALADARPSPRPIWDVLGMDLKPLPTDEFRQTYQTRYRGGLVVTAVRPESPAANQGIRRGDVLVGMHVWETISLENVTYILERPDFPSLNPIKFFILRGSETLYGYIPVAMKKAAARD